MMNPDNPAVPVTLYSTADGIVDCPLGDGLALLNTRTGEYFELNVSGRILWQAARSPIDVRRAVEALATHFLAPRDVMAVDAAVILHQLVEAGLMISHQAGVLGENERTGAASGVIGG